MYLPLVDRLEHLLFWGQTVGVTGDGPYEARAIEKIITLEGGLVGDKDVWQPNQLLVIGREHFDRDYLRESVRILYSENKTPCEYISQEDFWSAWLYRDHTLHKPHFKGDRRIHDHPGLKFLSSIGFPWPPLDNRGSLGDGTGGLSGRLNDISDLRRYCGYRVASGITQEERRQKLSRAVKPPPFGLGLRSVANTIAGHIRRFGRKDQPPVEAISKWKADLDWLQRTYYEGQIYSFVWPDLDLPNTLHQLVEERSPEIEST